MTDLTADLTPEQRERIEEIKHELADAERHRLPVKRRRARWPSQATVGGDDLA